MRGWCVACGLVLAIGGQRHLALLLATPPGRLVPLMTHFRGFLGTIRTLCPSTSTTMPLMCSKNVFAPVVVVVLSVKSRICGIKA